MSDIPSAPSFWRLRHIVPLVIAAVVLVAAGWFLVHAFRGVTWHDFISAIRAQHWQRIAGVLGLTFISFTALALYDVFAAHVTAPGRVGFWPAAFAGAAGNAVSNTLGFHSVTGSAVRYLIYNRSGLSLADIARIISLSWAALGLGYLTMMCAALLIEPMTLPLSGVPSQFVGIALVVFLGALLLWLGRSGRTLKLWRLSITLPNAAITATQMLLGGIEMGATVGALYILLPPDLAPSFTTFAVAFIGSVLLGVVAHAPGGVGVFEASVTAILAGSGRADLLAALFLFRVLYNILPFTLAAVSLAVFEAAGVKKA